MGILFYFVNWQSVIQKSTQEIRANREGEEAAKTKSSVPSQAWQGCCSSMNLATVVVIMEQRMIRQAQLQRADEGWGLKVFQLNFFKELGSPTEVHRAEK